MQIYHRAALIPDRYMYGWAISCVAKDDGFPNPLIFCEWLTLVCVKDNVGAETAYIRWVS